jgi:hypothetical protein
VQYSYHLMSPKIGLSFKTCIVEYCIVEFAWTRMLIRGHFLILHFSLFQVVVLCIKKLCFGSLTGTWHLPINSKTSQQECLTTVLFSPELTYNMDVRGVGVRVPVEARFFSSPRGPNRFWGPPSLLFNGYTGPFPRG